MEKIEFLIDDQFPKMNEGSKFDSVFFYGFVLTSGNLHFYKVSESLMNACHVHVDVALLLLSAFSQENGGRSTRLFLEIRGTDVEIARWHKLSKTVQSILSSTESIQHFVTES